jgi:hypothetical protein
LYMELQAREDALEKEAVLDLALGLGTGIATAAGLPSLIGMAGHGLHAAGRGAAALGGFFKSKGLQRAGSKLKQWGGSGEYMAESGGLRRVGSKADMWFRDFLNKGYSFGTYDGRNLKGVPMLGDRGGVPGSGAFDTRPDRKITAQRALMWGSTAMIPVEMGKGLYDAARGPRPPQPPKPPKAPQPPQPPQAPEPPKFKFNQ